MAMARWRRLGPTESEEKRESEPWTRRSDPGLATCRGPRQLESAVALFFELRLCSTSGKRSPSIPTPFALATATGVIVDHRPSSATPPLAMDTAGSPSPTSTRTLYFVYPRRRPPSVALRHRHRYHQDYEFVEEQEFYPEVPPSPFADQGKSSTTSVETVDHY
ncbi:hypothetical protein GUJ93_ZPchr0012g22177 [Zizania palustris]|uniref:Uncharacterized protein n=1 Tax=Zizania palustris TaxID=103762 RepID=A0A8J5WSU5_ZIZPA|nr:hypothetical protein GUJ93_ZPchr0012g22177 [Zizania palustris]